MKLSFNFKGLDLEVEFRRPDKECPLQFDSVLCHGNDVSELFEDFEVWESLEEAVYVAIEALR